MTSFTTEMAVAWLRGFATAIADHHDELTRLDSAIGDADHGANMMRGTAAVVDNLAPDSHRPIIEVMKDAGRTLVSRVGGASGPLYGTFMLRFSAPDGATAMSADELVGALAAACDGVVMRGKAEQGDKTMLDALAPAVAALAEAVSRGVELGEAIDLAAAAAAQGRDETKPMVARKGRASYLGERSAGHIDPGAASATLLFVALADAVNGR